MMRTMTKTMTMAVIVIVTVTTGKDMTAMLLYPETPTSVERIRL
jgi:hypothetical protein